MGLEPTTQTKYLKIPTGRRQNSGCLQSAAEEQRNREQI